MKDLATIAAVFAGVLGVPTAVSVALALALSSSDSCHLDAERIEGGTRVCFYDCQGRPYVVRVSPSKECPSVLRPSWD